MIDVYGQFVLHDTEHERYCWKFVEMNELVRSFVLEVCVSNFNYQRL